MVEIRAMSVLEPIEIPESAYAPKRWFKERPRPDIVRGIKEFVAETGKPYLWRGHTHNKPPQGAGVRYVGEFDLPASCKPRHRWAPCPCCCPNFPKYRIDGKIAWFPDEQVVRLIGPDCFAALNPEGHRTAVAELHAEQEREKDIHYLLQSLPAIPEMLDVIDSALPLSEALDEFRYDLRSRLDDVLRIPLWREAASGELRVRVRRKEVYRRRDGSEGEREVEDFAVYARVQGMNLLNPRLQRFARRLAGVAEKLSEIQVEDHDEAVSSMSDHERAAVAKTLGRSLGRARRVFEEMEEARRFASPVTVATLRSWLQQEGAPFRFHIARSGRDFYIGRSSEQQIRIELDPAFDTVPRALPRLGETSISQR